MLDRPVISGPAEQKCLEEFQMTMLEHTNKYRSLYGLKPLRVSKKLQYVALLTAQRCHVIGCIEAGESLQLFNTEGDDLFEYTTRSIECKKYAVDRASYFYDSENWNLLNKRFDYTYLGCAVSILNSIAYHVCKYQTDKGADKLRLNILPTTNNMDLESYNDSFWTRFTGKSKLILISISFRLGILSFLSI